MMGDMRESWERFSEWSGRLRAELVALPDTLQLIREGASNFDRVAKRLAESTKALDDVTRVYESTMAGTARRSAEAVEALRDQIGTINAEAPNQVTTAMRDSMREMQRTAEALADLNPLWPRRRPRDD